MTHDDTPTPRTDAIHQKYITAAFARQLERELTAMSEQRDEWKAKYIQQNKDLGCEQMDPDGTIWDYAKKVQTDLSTMTEQRDRLAEALRMITTFDYTDLQCDNGHGARFVAIEALKSLTTNEQ